MSINSSITVKCRDGKYRTIYSHWDGYPEHHMPILTGFYNDQEMAEKLVRLGDLSILAESIECPKGHSFDTPMEGYTVFYGRDRGEKKVGCKIRASYQGCLNVNERTYNYLWNGEEWSWRKKE